MLNVMPAGCLKYLGRFAAQIWAAWSDMRLYWTKSSTIGLATGLNENKSDNDSDNPRCKGKAKQNSQKEENVEDADDKFLDRRSDDVPYCGRDIAHHNKG